MKKLPLALLVAVATGCSTISDRPASQDPTATWQARQSQLIALKSWRVQGRLSARTPDDGWQASVRWVRDNDRHDIDLWGPLGRGHVRLVQDRYGAVLRDAQDNTYWAEDGQRLLFDTTGWWLPLDGLNYWVLGVPMPQTPNEHDLDQWGRLTKLTQLGWDIEFLQYQRQGTYEFPRKLFIRRQLDSAHTVNQGTNNRTLEVRMVIERWTMTP